MIKNDKELEHTQKQIQMLKDNLMNGLETAPPELHEALVGQRSSLIRELEKEVCDYHKNRHAL